VEQLVSAPALFGYRPEILLDNPRRSVRLDVATVRILGLREGRTAGHSSQSGGSRSREKPPPLYRWRAFCHAFSWYDGRNICLLFTYTATSEWPTTKTAGNREILYS